MSKPRNKYYLIHAVATCDDCGWNDEGYLTAQKTGRAHHVKTGHRVHIETGHFIEYKRKGQNAA